MAIAPKSLSFIFILALFSIQIHARDSQFFSKVTTINPTTTSTIDGKNGKETTAVPTNEQESVTRQEREPTFTHETQNGNYGLYSQQQEETNQFPTTTKLGNSPYTTTTTYTPYGAQTQETYTNSYPTSNNYYDQNNQFYNADNYNNNNAYYEEQQQQEEDTRDTRYYYPSTRTSTYSTNNNNNNVEKQGMSDTRYLENGKYYYDVKNEKYNYHPTHQYQNSRSSYTTEGYNYNNNNNEQFYDTNSNNEQFSEYRNTMGNYQNQEQYIP